MRLRQHLREILRSRVREHERMLLSRLSVAAGLRPRVNRAAGGTLTFPEGRKAAVVVSADLELAWAWRYARAQDPIGLALQRARQGRHNLGAVLDLCDQYQLPVTWAVVGHLFLESCRRSDGKIHPELPRVPHFSNELWAYKTGDWFDHDPGASAGAQRDWADWYGPDLIRSILGRSVGHEIGCHTFSHAVFSDLHCPANVATAELSRCQEAAAEWGLQLRSFAFTGNIEGNHQALRDTGFSIYRIDDWYDLDIPRRDTLGLWRLNGGVCLDRPYDDSPSTDHVRLAKRCVDLAIEHGLVCGLWFHPETAPHDIQEIFPPVFEYIASRRDDLWVTTMAGMAGWLDSVAPQSPAEPRQTTGTASIS